MVSSFSKTLRVKAWKTALSKTALNEETKQVILHTVQNDPDQFLIQLKWRDKSAVYKRFGRDISRMAVKGDELGKKSFVNLFEVNSRSSDLFLSRFSSYTLRDFEYFAEALIENSQDKLDILLPVIGGNVQTAKGPVNEDPIKTQFSLRILNSTAGSVPRSENFLLSADQAAAILSKTPTISAEAAFRASTEVTKLFDSGSWNAEAAFSNVEKILDLNLGYLTRDAKSSYLHSIYEIEIPQEATRTAVVNRILNERVLEARGLIRKVNAQKRIIEEEGSDGWTISADVAIEEKP